jgi:cytochrome c biogenesis protein CcdA
MQNKSNRKMVHKIFTFFSILVIIISSSVVGVTALSDYNEEYIYYISVIFALIALISGTMLLYFQVPAAEEEGE